jgi:SurA N-terminal domain
VGAAAIVGNDRITQSSLNDEVSNLQQGVTQYHLQSAIPASAYPVAVLTWLVRFNIQDQAAQNAGITVSPEDTQNALKQLDSQERAAAQQQSQAYPGLDPLLVANGVPPNLVNDFGRWEAQQGAFLAKANGGKPPATQAEETAAIGKLNAAQCQAVKSIGIQINPQYGQLNYQLSSGQGVWGVTTSVATLSRAGGAATTTKASSSTSC